MADSSHGHTPAAWTGVTIAFIGFCMGAVFMVAAEPLGVVAGFVVIALGGVVGMVMRSMGLGRAKEDAEPQRRPEEAQSQNREAVAGS
jgi:hypothetical protein